MSMIQAGVIGVIGAVLAVQLKAGKSEYGIYVCVATGVILFSLIVDRLGIFISTLEQITSYIDLDAGYLSTMFKMIGITYIAEFSSGICRDAGYQTLAGQIEIFGKLTILVLGLPVLLTLLQTIQEFLS
ncbi:MAG TPA: stage III sporulation protein AD [Candidatus Mediterraneibacter faecipullorum]|uniref:Stage III sporulation protein AD n=1 Tax=Candidatus Mediterraneibacter faecipullorum TaxID=2838670 RepID=A0A9D2NLW0_9FIRM|nr:stage III sporulation protein AD [Candidatus Mediterraneibacter faecipullorum]